jgi:hypothetical protein
MTDDELDVAWTALQPTETERRRMEARVLAWLEARDTPLAAEWIGLFRVAPLSSAGFLAVSAIAIATTPPVLWMARALL